MVSLSVTTPVDVGALPEYPIDPETRLDSHSFIQWEFRRWMDSDMRWNATHECKSLWFELVNLAHGGTPVGTLPDDLKRLARMVQPVVDADHFANLCKMEFGPLHGWQRCLCGGEVRLMHPVVTRIVLSALASRANHAARVEESSNARRLKRLTENVMELAPSVAADSRMVKWIDAFINERIRARGGSRRTVEDLHTAIQRCLEEDRKGRFPKKPQN